MLRRFFFTLIIFLSIFSILHAEETEVIQDLLQNATVKDSGVEIPWDGKSTARPVIFNFQNEYQEQLEIKIIHPFSFSLFLNERLIYRNEEADTFVISIDSIKSITYKKTLRFQALAENLNAINFKAQLLRDKIYQEASILEKEELPVFSSSFIFINLGLLFLVGITRVLSKREYEFYFSGSYLVSPRLIIERFLGDSLNPFLLALSSMLLLIFLSRHILPDQIPNKGDLSLLALKLNGYLFQTIIVASGILIYLFLKRMLYLFYSWVTQNIRNFSQLWRTYLLSFTNLSFWLFLLSEIPVMLMPNFEFGNYFQILFFIFAALNAVGGIMTSLNFNLKGNIIVISGILVIDVFPIILLVHLLTF